MGSGEGGAAWGPATIAVRGGREPEMGDGVSPPIHLASTFVQPGEPGPGIHSYARATSPAFGPLEQALTEMEGGAETVVFNAGSAAAIALLDEVEPGTAVVMPPDAYYGIRVYAEQHLTRRGAEVRLVDPRDLGA